MSEKTGELIRQYRLERNLTQEQLGKKIGVTMQYIGQYERGLRNPKRSTLKKIADALGVDVYSIADWDTASKMLENDINSEVLDPPITADDLEVVKKYRTLNACGRDIVNHVLDAPMYHEEPERIHFAARGGASGTMSREEAEKIKAQPEIDDI